MCCRYYVDSVPETGPYLTALNRSPLRNAMQELLEKTLIEKGEVRPSDLAMVIAPDKSLTPTVYPMRWGFSSPRSSRLLINCRVETAPEKPLWKEAWARRRCAVPMSWYYEWEHLADPRTGKMKTGPKYRLQPRGRSLSCLAGLYRIEEKAGLRFPVFTVLTREPSKDIRFLHDRMPVILDRSLVPLWLNPESRPAEVLDRAVTEMDFEKTP